MRLHHVERKHEGRNVFQGRNGGSIANRNADVRALRESITHGLKGMAAYAEHAANLGFEDEEIYTFVQDALVKTNKGLSLKELIALALECVKAGVKAMALSDKANTSTYGHSELTEVDLGVRKNSGILISGHDLKDLEEFLQQSKDSEVDTYTHTVKCFLLIIIRYLRSISTLPVIMELYGGTKRKISKHLYGVFLFTTNCMVPPKQRVSYSKQGVHHGNCRFPRFSLCCR